MVRHVALGGGKKISFRHSLDEPIDALLIVIFCQLAARPRLDPPQDRPDILAFEFALFHFLEEIQRLDVELAQQRRLPRIPHVGADAFDVGKSQEVEHLEVLNVPNRPGEIEDRFLIFQVAAKGGVGHQQVVAHQEFHRRPVIGVKTHAPGDGPHDPGADFRMAAAETFADVVKHEAEI